MRKMEWTHCVSDLPIPDLSLFDSYCRSRYFQAVAVEHSIYLFCVKDSCEEKSIEVLIFNPMTSNCSVIDPVSGKASSFNKVFVPRGEIINFAVPYKEKVYVCVGECTTSIGDELHVFDTRSLQWSRVMTSGDVPSNCIRWWVCACEHDGHVYFGAVSSDVKVTCLWALEINSLRWKHVATGVGTSRVYIPHCIVPYNNRIYIVLEEPGIEFGVEISYFDLVTKEWGMLELHGTKPFTMLRWISFVHRDKLYGFINDIDISDYKLGHGFGNTILKEVFVRYSFAQNNWERVWFNGEAPPEVLDAVCVVANKAVFFSTDWKTAHVLDFVPSLRSLCFQVVSKHQLDSTSLPVHLKRELSMYNCLPDVKKTEIGMENSSFSK